MNIKNKEIIVTQLAEIKRLNAAITASEKAYNERIAAMKDEYLANIAGDAEKLDTARKTLLKHLKKNKNDIFPGKTDRVTMPGGILIRQIKKAVRKAKHITVEFLKEKGKSNAIRTEEFVSWDTIETWSDDELVEIDTDRISKESFAFEVTGK